MDSRFRGNDGGGGEANPESTGTRPAVARRETTMDGFLALYIFMLAAFTGHEIISRVPVILHTPLMSGSNFVHGIVVVGAMVVLAHADTTLGKAIGFAAVALGAGNAAGGYVVTERMLDMFKTSKPAPKKA
jgi:NAD(P) transhydrogenase subunit alpha